MVGQTISRYRILKKLGAGGMGEVYLAEDTVLGRKLALKFILQSEHPDARERLRFFNEAKSAAALDHPFICKIYETGEAEGKAFISMEYIAGKTLKEKLESGPIQIHEALQIAVEIAEALHEAHRQKIIHRDLKPANVMLDRQGHVKVLDFGLAKQLRSQDISSASKQSTGDAVTLPGAAVGTLAYMSPEQLRGEDVDARSDIFSFGILLYEMIAGTHPFKRPTPVETSAAIISEAPPPISRFQAHASSALQAVLMKTLAKNPAQRMASVDELLADLRHILTERSPHVSGRRPRRRLAIAVSGIIALLLLIAWLAPWSPRGEAEAVVREGSYALLADVENRTADSQLTANIRSVLENQLRQSTYLNIVEGARIREVLQRMLKPANTALDLQTAREVAWRDGIPLVISASLTQLGSTYLLNVRLDRMGPDQPTEPTNTWSESFRTQAEGKEAILKIIDSASTWIRKMSGEAAGDLSQTDLAAHMATTASWQALSLFSEAERFKSREELAEAVIQLKLAVEIDPEFALAYLRLGDILFSMRRQAEGFRYYQEALRAMAKGRLTKREEMQIKAIYAFDSGEYAEAEKLFHGYSLAFRNDYYPEFLHALTLKDLDRAEDALPLLNEAAQKAPSNYYIPVHLAMTSLLLGRIDQASVYISRLRTLGQDQWADSMEGARLVLQEQYEQAGAIFSTLSLSGNSMWRSRGAALLASLLAEKGKYREALQVLQEGIEFDARTGQEAERLDKLLAAAYLYSRTGNAEGLRNSCAEAIRLDQSPGRLQEAGALLARNGFIEDARRLLSMPEFDFPAPIFRVAGLRILGEILLAEGRKKAALREFELASKMESPSAIREYLARARKMAGDPTGALQAYRRIVESRARLWHYADKTSPGIWADCLTQYADLAMSLNQRENLEHDVQRLLNLRGGADATLADVPHARSILRQLQQKNPF